MRYCPLCSREVDEGVGECPSCRTATVRMPRDPDDDAGREEIGPPVLVLETGDLSLLLAAKAVFDSAEIPYISRGEGLQDLLGLGRMGTGFNMLAGPARLLVPEEFADEARRLIAELTEPGDASRH